MAQLVFMVRGAWCSDKKILVGVFIYWASWSLIFLMMRTPYELYHCHDICGSIYI